MSTKPGLGKGLGALLPSDPALSSALGNYFLCPIEAIKANPAQPRKKMKVQELEELAASIRQKGVLQPLVVRRQGEDLYELIAGERRWRAAQLAGLREVPVAVQDASPAEALELALIENIQRQDLNPLEEAEAYERLMKEFALSQEEVAKKVGRERSTVANFLRLNRLPDYAKEDLTDETISMGHARALLSLNDADTQKELRNQIVTRGLSVRQSEAMAKKLAKGAQAKRKLTKNQPREIPAEYCQVLCNDLVRYLGTKVDIVPKRGPRGKIEIEYYSADDLERLLGLIVKD